MPDDSTTTPRQEPRIAIGASWCCLVASFALSAITWVALGRIAGYGGLSYLMPFVVDLYIVGAIVTWLQPVSERVARFAYWNMYGAAALGVISQAIYHCASVWARTHTAWEALLALIVGSIPPLFAFLGVHLRGLARREINDRPRATVAVERIVDTPSVAPSPQPGISAPPARTELTTPATAAKPIPPAARPVQQYNPTRPPLATPIRQNRPAPGNPPSRTRIPTSFSTNDERRQAVIRLLQQGHLTQQAIATRTGMSLRGVQTNAKQLGLTKTRPRREQEATA